jgi:MFS family permease
MWIFPLAAAIVAVVFAALVTKEFAVRRRPYLAAWAIALFMFAAASGAAFLGILNGWDTKLYGVYWLFGAILNVPFLAAGEAMLLFRNKNVGAVVFLVLVFMSAFAFNAVRSADMRGVALHCRDLPLGKAVFSEEGPAPLPAASGSIQQQPCFEGGDSQQLPYHLAQWFSYPAFALLVAGAVWSAIRMRRSPQSRNRFLGTVGIAVGATIVAIGSGVGAGLDVVWLFSTCLAAGIAVMFWGFLRASRRPAAAPQ